MLSGDLRTAQRIGVSSDSRSFKRWCLSRKVLRVPNIGSHSLKRVASRIRFSVTLQKDIFWSLWLSARFACYKDDRSRTEPLQGTTDFQHVRFPVVGEQTFIMCQAPTLVSTLVGEFAFPICESPSDTCCCACGCIWGCVKIAANIAVSLQPQPRKLFIP